MAESFDRRDLILSSAAEMFARKGIKSTTVREIGDAVGVLSGSLYHYFDAKDTIVQEILKGFLETIRVRYAEVLAQGAEPADALRALVVVSLRIASEQPDATAIYQGEQQYLRERPRFKEIHDAVADVQGIWLGVIERGVADGSFRDDIPPQVFHRLIRDAVWLSGRWYSAGGEFSADQLAAAITSIFLDGFSARPAVRLAESPDSRRG